jgi:hypothetical protein
MTPTFGQTYASDCSTNSPVWQPQTVREACVTDVAWVALHPWHVVVHRQELFWFLWQVESPRGDTTAAPCRSNHAYIGGYSGLLGDLQMPTWRLAPSGDTQSVKHVVEMLGKGVDGSAWPSFPYMAGCVPLYVVLQNGVHVPRDISGCPAQVSCANATSLMITPTFVMLLHLLW